MKATKSTRTITTSVDVTAC